MRLSNSEIDGIIQGITPFITITPAELRLYGSRVDDQKKGGDIDLLLIVPSNLKDTIKFEKHKILAKIKNNIGDRKIDLLICDDASLQSDPFVTLIFPTSTALKTWE